MGYIANQTGVSALPTGVPSVDFFGNLSKGRHGGRDVGLSTATSVGESLKRSGEELSVRRLKERHTTLPSESFYLYRKDSDSSCFDTQNSEPFDVELENYGASDVYAFSIGQFGNSDDPNDIVPDMLVRMSKARDNGIDDNLRLVIRQGDISKFYSRDTPLGGSIVEDDQLESAIYVDLDEDEKGDSMYCKILAGVHGVNQSEVSDSQVATLRGHIATFVRNHPELAEDANQALENDPLYGLESDEAIDVYKNTPHREDRIYSHQPVRSWLEPLVYLLSGVMPVVHNAIKGDPLFGPLPPKKVTDLSLRDESKAFHHFINDHKNMDKFITELDRGLEEAEKRGPMCYEGEDPVQLGKKLSQQLKQTMERGHVLTEAGSENVLKYLIKYGEIYSNGCKSVPPETRMPENYKPGASTATGDTSTASEGAGARNPSWMLWVTDGFQGFLNILPKDPLVFPGADGFLHREACGAIVGRPMVVTGMFAGIVFTVPTIFSLFRGIITSKSGEDREISKVDNADADSDSVALGHPVAQPSTYIPATHFTDEPFIFYLLNNVVGTIAEYEYDIGDLFGTIAYRLMSAWGTKAYSEEDFDRYMKQYKELCIKKRGNIALIREQKRLNHYLEFVQPDDGTQFALTDIVAWVEVEDNGLTLMVPYKMRHVLSGALSKSDPEKVLLSSQLENSRDLFTNKKYRKIMNEIYVGNELDNILLPIKERLNAITFPDLFVESIFNKIKSSTIGNLNTECDTQIGEYTVEEQCRGFVACSRETKAYTPCDILLNTGGGISISDVRRRLYLVYQRSSPMMSFAQQLLSTNLQTEMNNYVNKINEDPEFEKGLKKLMHMNVKHFRNHIFRKIGEHEIQIGPVRHPFITATFGKRNRYAFPLAHAKVFLFSYLTGQRFRISSYDQFKKDIVDKKSDLFRWMSLNGGQYPALLLLNQEEVRFTPFQMKNFAVIDNSRRCLFPCYGDRRVYKWVSMNKQQSDFINDAPSRVLSMTKDYINHIHTDYDEALRRKAFEVIQEFISVLGYVPIVGDLLDIVGTVVMMTTEMALETDYLTRKSAESNFLAVIGISTAISFLPGVTMSVGKKIVKKVSKVLRKGIKKPTTKVGDRLVSFRTVATPEFKKKKLSIAPDSFEWKVKCGSRKKRMFKIHRNAFCMLPAASSSSATFSIRDELYQSKWLSFATKEEGRLPTLYYNHPKYGSGRLRMEHPNGEAILRSNYHMEHSFFPTREALGDFLQAVRSGPRTIENFEHLLRKHGGRPFPSNGYYHLEAEFWGSNKSAHMVSTHQSGGTVLVGSELEKLRSRADDLYANMKALRVRDTELVEITNLDDAIRAKDTIERVKQSMEGLDIDEVISLLGNEETMDSFVALLKKYKLERFGVTLFDESKKLLQWSKSATLPDIPVDLQRADHLCKQMKDQLKIYKNDAGMIVPPTSVEERIRYDNLISRIQTTENGLYKPKLEAYQEKLAEMIGRLKSVSSLVASDYMLANAIPHADSTKSIFSEIILEMVHDNLFKRTKLTPLGKT